MLHHYSFILDSQERRKVKLRLPQLPCAHSRILEMSDGEEEEEELTVELEMDSKRRIAGTEESGIDQSPFRGWLGRLSTGKGEKAGGSGARKGVGSQESGLVDKLKEDCAVLFGCEELDGDSCIVPATWTKKDARCSLERLAMEVFLFHTNGLVFDKKTSCAEWWVQMRGRTATKARAEGVVSGIGFHWDTDEDLVDQAGVRVCPQLSTVTYLTDGASPTVVFDKFPPLDYSDDAALYAGSIKRAWVSHPMTGKHIAFNGQLLHGASKLLARDPEAPRVTFLVNIWLNYTPIGLAPLEGHLVKRLSKLQKELVFQLPAREAPLAVDSVSVRRRDEGVWVHEDFGPNGVEHQLVYKWPKDASVGEESGSGSVCATFLAGSEARIGTRREGKRKRDYD